MSIKFRVNFFCRNQKKLLQSFFWFCLPLEIHVRLKRVKNQGHPLVTRITLENLIFRENILIDISREPKTVRNEC